MSGKRIRRHSVDEISRLVPGKTDLDYLGRVSDGEIEAAMADDPDWADLIALDWSEAVVVIPKRKKAVSIRLDEDVIDFFKRKGEGYQTRMNAVLRHYMEKTRKPDAAE